MSQLSIIFSGLKALNFVSVTGKICDSVTYNGFQPGQAACASRAYYGKLHWKLFCNDTPTAQTSGK